MIFVINTIKLQTRQIYCLQNPDWKFYPMKLQRTLVIPKYSVSRILLKHTYI